MKKYRTVYSDIRNDIVNRQVLKPNDRLPNERQLGEHYSVSKMTVKKALDMLSEEGLIYKKQGAGTFVMGLSEEQLENYSNQTNEPSGQLKGFTANNKGKDISTRVFEFSIIAPTKKVAQKLQIDQDQFVYKILRVRNIENKPTIYEETYMPINLIQGLKMSHVEQSIYAYISDALHYKIQSSHVDIWVTKADQHLSEVLDIPINDPVPIVEQVALLDNGLPFEYSISRHAYSSFRMQTVLINKS